MDPFTARRPKRYLPTHDFIGTTVVGFRNVQKPLNESSMRPYFLVGVGRVGEDCHALVPSEATCRIVPTMVSKPPQAGLFPFQMA